MLPNLRIITLLVLTLSFTACTTTNSENLNGEVKLKSEWTLTELDSPESVIPNSDSSFLYVSNVNGDATDKDANGYISKVSFDGKIIEKKWATGFNAPKGLALKDSVLYVSDIDQLVLIDTQSGNILSKVDVAGAKFLNDVAKVDDVILISDSATATIHQFIDNKVSVWMQDEKLAGVNGIQQENKHVLITTMQSGTLYQSTLSNKELIKIADGMQNADGIGLLGNNSYLISSWKGKLFHVKKDASVKVILDTEADGSNMNDFLLFNNQLLNTFQDLH